MAGFEAIACTSESRNINIPPIPYTAITEAIYSHETLQRAFSYCYVSYLVFSIELQYRPSSVAVLLITKSSTPLTRLGLVPF